MCRSKVAGFCTILCALLPATRAGDSGLPGPVIPSGFGVNIHFTDPVPGEMDRFGEAGYRLARMDLTWSGIEREKGAYDFAAYDRLLAHLANAGARPLFILDYGNRLYDDGLSPHTEAGRAAFARFAAASAAHFRGKGVIWEIWNEPNLAQFWKPEPNAGDYAKLAIATAKAIHRSDPDAVVLAPGSSEFPWDFFEAVFRAGVLEHVDAVSVHPYRGRPPESAADDFGRLRALIARHAPPDKQRMPIVSSEWGYSTAAGGVSEAQQARFLARMWLANLAAGVNLSIFYDWRDDGDDANEREHRFGTVRRDFRPKPAFLATRSLIGELDGFAFRHRIAGKSADDWQLLFQRGDSEELSLVTWNADPNVPDTQQAPAIRRIVPLDDDFVSLHRLASVRFPAGALTEATGRPAELDVTVGESREPGGAVTVAAADASVQIALQPGQAVTRRLTLTVPDVRDERRDVPLSVLWDGERLPALAPSVVWRVDPLRLSAVPRGDELVTMIENPARGAFRGTLNIVDGARTSASKSISIPEGNERETLSIPRPEKWHGLAVKSSAGKAVATLTPRRYEAMAGFPAKAGPESGYGLTLFVENKPGQRTRIAAVAAGPNAPAPVALSVQYQFDRGWRYAEAVPSQSAAIPEGVRAVTFWARSSAEGDHLRSRFRDSTGQTFQVDLGRLGWTGWRPVTVPLDGSHVGAFWGGAEDGVPHEPLSWEGLVLIDSARRDSPHSGELLIASPSYVFAE
jgi:hypothetical protein